jgi:MFS family permease
VFAGLNIGKPGIAGAILQDRRQDPQKADDHRRTAQDRVFRRHWLAIVSTWFDRRRGLAISIAFNGATCGGIIIAPTLVVLVGAIGFTRAMLTMTVAMIVILIPVVISLIGLSVPAGRPLQGGNQGESIPTKSVPPTTSRRKLLRNFGFWTIAAPFALALLAQIGFIVHQIAFLEPTMGRSLAGFAGRLRRPSTLRPPRPTPHRASSLSRVLASFRSRVSKPSVNQP